MATLTGGLRAADRRPALVFHLDPALCGRLSDRAHRGAWRRSLQGALAAGSQKPLAIGEALETLREKNAVVRRLNRRSTCPCLTSWMR
jgi:hypothetical protein